MNRWIPRINFLIIFLLLPCISVHASAQDVILKTEENKVEVIMGESEEKAVSMQFTLEVKVTEGAEDANVSFEFDPGIAGSVRQYRYDRDSGTLNVYLSGSRQQNLFEKGELCVGKVVLDGGGGAAAATVGVRPDSLQIVNDAYDLYRFGEVNATPEQKVTDGSVSEEPPVSDGEEEYPPESPGSSSGESSGSSSGESSGSSSGTSSSSSGNAGSLNSGESTDAVPPERVKTRRDVGIRTTGSQTASGETEEEQEQELSGEESDAEDADKSSEEDQEPEEADAEKPQKAADSGYSVWTDWILLAALAAAGIAAGVVIWLMIREYHRKKTKVQRKQEKNRKRKRKPSPGRKK